MISQAQGAILLRRRNQKACDSARALPPPTLLKPPRSPLPRDHRAQKASRSRLSPHCVSSASSWRTSSSRRRFPCGTAVVMIAKSGLKWRWTKSETILEQYFITQRHPDLACFRTGDTIGSKLRLDAPPGARLMWAGSIRSGYGRSLKYCDGEGDRDWTGATALTAKDFEKVVHHVFTFRRRPRRF